MKLLKYFLLTAILFASTAISAQNLYVKATNGTLVKVGRHETLITTDSALNIIDTLAITDNTAGMLEVQVSGYDSVGNGVTGKQIYRYKKTAGTITLSSATNISAIVTDAGLGTATYTFTTTASENLQLKTKGKLNVTVKWRSNIQQFSYLL